MLLRKLISMPVLILLSIFLISGCGGSDENTENSQQGGSTQTVTAPVAKPPISAQDIVQQSQDSWHFKFFAANVARGPEGNQKAHYSDSCIECHSAVKMFDDKDAKLADFYPGGKYADQVEGVSCRVCHDFTGFEGIKLRKEGWAVCGDCHTGEPVLGKAVHHPQNEMIRGVGVGDVSNIPSYKCYNMIDFTCYDCHVTNASKHDFMVPGVTVTHDGAARTGSTMDYTKFKEVFEQERCKSCHIIPEDIVESVRKKQETISKKLEELKPKYDEWSEKSGTMPKDDPRLKTFMEATTYYTYVEADSSKGAHNYELAKALLEKAEEKFSQLK